MEKQIKKAPNLRFACCCLTKQPADSPWHMPIQIILAKKEGVAITVSKDEHHLLPGQLLFLWPHEKYEILAAPKNAALLCTIDPSVITACGDICTVYHLLTRIRILDDRRPELYHNVRTLLDELCATPKEEELFHQTKNLIRIEKMLMELSLSVYDGNEEETPKTGRSKSLSRMQDACTYIASHCREEIRQTEVAEYINITPFYFSRLFKQYTGKSFSKYVNDYRLDLAKTLLANTKISVKDVGRESGFHCQSSFNKTFLQEVGMSPNKYRSENGLKTR